jgi:transposase InsO family protein
MPRALAHARRCIAGVSLRPLSGLPDELEAQIEASAESYNHQRYHESINNVTPAEV